MIEKDSIRRKNLSGLEIRPRKIIKLDVDEEERKDRLWVVREGMPEDLEGLGRGKQKGS